MGKIRVVAAVVDAKKLTIYKEDGSTIELAQGDARIENILKVVLPICSVGGIAEVDESALLLNYDNGETYRNFEQRSGGIVGFWKVAKKRVTDFFAGNTYEAEKAKADAIVENLTNPHQAPNPSTREETIKKEVAEVMADAVPIATSETGIDEESESVVAVIDNIVIPGVEKISHYFQRASSMGSTIGIENFLRRIAQVIEKRRHSIDDLLGFLEKADLPIADDGTIVAYKRLKTSGQAGVYVDVHSGNVFQRPGSYVYMKEDMVDPSRTHSCSNGLHIASRGYLRSFSGDVMVLCKVPPENVIAVPNSDRTKVRVCGYQILEVLPTKIANLLNNNRPMTEDPEGKGILARALSGNHSGINQMVEIGGQQGTKLVINDLMEELPPSQAPTPLTLERVSKTDILPEKAKPGEAPKSDPVDPKKISKAAQTNKAAKAKPKSKNELAAEMLAFISDSSHDMNARIAKAKELLEFKKKAKKGWSALGISDGDVKFIIATSEAAVSGTKEEKPAPKKAAPKVKTKAKAKPKVTTKPKPKMTQKDIKPSAMEAPKKSAASKNLTNAELARELFDSRQFTELKLLKKTKKKSWTALGFTDAEIQKIEANKS